MKKNGKFLFAFIALALFFSGCEDDVTTSSFQLDLTKTGTVEVHLFAELDRQQLGLERVPNGTNVLFTIDYSEFNSNVTHGKWSRAGIVNNGIVKLDSVPSTDSGVMVRIIPEDFVFNQVQPFGAPVETLPRLFSANSVNLMVYPGQTSFREINYSFQNIGMPAITVTRSWVGSSVFDLTTGESSFVPSGTQLLMFNDNWAASTTVQANGRFTASVPYNQPFTVRFTAPMTVFDDDGNEVQRMYRYTVNAGPYFEDSPAAMPVFFNYQLWE